MLLQGSLSAPSISVLLTSSDVPVLIHIDVPWHVKAAFLNSLPSCKSGKQGLRRKAFIVSLLKACL